MGKEIERKYKVTGDQWRELTKGTVYRQGYLSTLKERVVRVRTMGNTGYLTIKGITEGASRLEYQYEISVSDSNDMLDQLCEKPIIEKKRFKVEFGGLIWEIDEFFGDNQGLIVAEVELKDENQKIELPPWIGDEIVDDPRYYNSNLIKHPYTKW